MPPRSAAHKRQMNSFPQILSKVARHIQGRRALCCPQFYASRDVRYTLDCTTSTRTYAVHTNYSTAANSLLLDGRLRTPNGEVVCARAPSLSSMHCANIGA